MAAPDGLRPFFYERIAQEIENVRRGLPAGIFAKVNSLADPAMVAKLYEASEAGVPITLVVRGICCLTPGVPGVSGNITVLSLVGQLLEHSRIFRFENGGNPKLYLGSADWMPRNLDRRVELVFPVEDERIRERVEEVIRLTTEDTVNARMEDREGKYAFKDMRKNDELNCQLELSRRARAASKKAQEEQGVE